MSEIVYIDGNYVPKAEATVSVFDHGLLYGDGVFEGIRIYHGNVFKLEEHTKRLFESARAICLDIQMSEAQMNEAIATTVKKNNLESGYVRAVVTRGVGDLGLNPFKCPKACVIIIAANIQLYPESFYEEGLKIVTAATPRNNPEAINPKIKSLNYLNNILAKIEGLKAGAPETLMLNHKGLVAECTGDNIFIIKDGAISTPDESAGILVGITRNFVMDIAREKGLSVTERPLSRFDIYTADECFLTGTAAEVVPVIELDGRPIGSGKVGATTKQLIADFRAKVKALS